MFGARLGGSARVLAAVFEGAKAVSVAHYWMRTTSRALLHSPSRL